MPQTRKNTSRLALSSRLFWGTGTCIWLLHRDLELMLAYTFFRNKTLKAKLHPVKSFQSHGKKMFCFFFLGGGVGWNFQEKYTAASTAHLPYDVLHPPHSPQPSGKVLRNVPGLAIKNQFERSSQNHHPKTSGFDGWEKLSWSPGLVVFPVAGRVMFFFGEGDESRNVQVARSVSDPLNRFFKT